MTPPNRDGEETPLRVVFLCARATRDTVVVAMSQKRGAFAFSLALAACAEQAPPPLPPPRPPPAAQESPPPQPKESPPAPEHANPSPPDGPVSLRSQSSGRCLDISNEEQDQPAGFWAKLGKRAFETKLQKEPGPFVHQWKCSGRITQRFRMKRQLDGTVALRSTATDLCLDAGVIKTKPHTIVQAPCNGSPEQSFRVEPRREGTLVIISQSSGQCLQPAPSTWPEGGLIEQRGCIDASEQRFVLGP
jgi:hypothetical protein